ncbi:MAG: allantoicase, partial [Pseudonocardiaceae bacterium]
MSADLPDLALRTLGGAVIAANDEFFADKENLIKPDAPVFVPQTFTAKGQVYDGWETRRRREPGHDGGDHDWALIRLGAPGIPRAVVVDTAHFTGNYPPYASVEATAVDGYPSPGELHEADWQQLVPRSPLRGDTRHEFAVPDAPWCTHVRLSIYPDGGVARIKVHGEPLPDPRELAGLPLDLAATRNGGRAVACSDSFFSRPDNMLQPGESRFMGDGWETARRRDDGNDWAIVALTAQAVPTVLELVTTHYKGNSPGHASLSGIDTTGGAELDDPDAWFPLQRRTRLQPDTTHRFRLAASEPVTHVRLDIHPDGGMGRLRLYGELTPDGRRDLTLRWLNALPPAHAAR